MSTAGNAIRFQAWKLDEVADRRRKAGRPYEEFLRVPSMNAGVYVLAAGAADPQQPHDEDELYYVVRGRARLEADGQATNVGPGSLLFVARRVPHRFVEIAEELEVLVFFSSARDGT